MNNYVTPFSSNQLTLDLAGGKGVNLARLTQAGFPVPPGFIITTQAYTDFLHKHQLDEKIKQILGMIDHTSPGSLEAASETIRKLFTDRLLSPDLVADITSAYHSFGFQSVAVRSSATAEDLPDVSFAGQQDTYLNVIGSDALIKAVLSCWGSLWTARAISYRFHNQIPQTHLALAVVVQEMVECDVSGVTFTANPLNGIRAQTVIDATLGLGEALVSGKVDPDQYTIDREKMLIISKKIGSKDISTRSAGGGGVETREEKNLQSQALTDDQIFEVTGLCQEVANHYGDPQDIEWGIIHGRIFLLQSRPITSLFPLPTGVTSHPLRVFGSFAAVQGVLNPITPLGQQALLLAMIGGAKTFGYNSSLEDHKTFRFAGERIWSDITPIIKNSAGQHLAPMILGIVEPTMRQVVLELVKDPRLQPERRGIRIRTVFRLVRFIIPVAGNVFLNMISPERRRVVNNRWLEGVIRTHDLENEGVEGSRDQKLAQRIAILERVTPLTQRIFPRLVSLVATGMVSLNLTHQLVAKINTSSQKERTENEQLYLALTRGLPHNVTTEMDLALWECARTIQSDAASFEIFSRSTPINLVKAYSNHSLPEAGQKAVDSFMSIYQLRGVGEIDMGRERWKENPSQVLQTLQSYIQINDPSKAPDEVFKRGEIVSTTAQRDILEKLGSQKHGRIKKHLAKALMRRYRAFGGLRETPKFSIIRLTGAVRMSLLESGAEYQRDGILEHPDDLFFLRISELKKLSAGIQKDWKGLVALRRSVDEREKTRRQIPRMFLSDGHAYYEGMFNPFPEGGNLLMGAPVSPGICEGFARIVLDPRQTSLSPGEILVCPGTDPAWTPLFLAAAGLVMEMGGLMTHGAVVAREYGIPAVVGVDKATMRIKTGQKIRVNGSNGQVELLT